MDVNQLFELYQKWHKKEKRFDARLVLNVDGSGGIEYTTFFGGEWGIEFWFKWYDIQQGCELLKRSLDGRQ